MRTQLGHYNVKLVFDYMTISTVTIAPYEPDENDEFDEDEVLKATFEFLNGYYGMDFSILGIIDHEIELEATS